MPREQLSHEGAARRPPLALPNCHKRTRPWLRLRLGVTTSLAHCYWLVVVTTCSIAATTMSGCSSWM